MKKLLLTVTILFGMTLGAYAEWSLESSNSNINYGEGGMFGRGKSMNTGVGSGFRNNFGLILPINHGLEGDSVAPLGGGVVVLLGMGGAYLVAKKRRKS